MRMLIFILMFPVLAIGQIKDKQLANVIDSNTVAGWGYIAGNTGISLTQTALKTTNYTALSGDLVYVGDTITITSPTLEAGLSFGVMIKDSSDFLSDVLVDLDGGTVYYGATDTLQNLGSRAVTIIYLATDQGWSEINRWYGNEPPNSPSAGQVTYTATGGSTFNPGSYGLVAGDIVQAIAIGGGGAGKQGNGGASGGGGGGLGWGAYVLTASDVSGGVSIQVGAGGATDGAAGGQSYFKDATTIQGGGGGGGASTIPFLGGAGGTYVGDGGGNGGDGGERLDPDTAGGGGGAGGYTGAGGEGGKGDNDPGPDPEGKDGTGGGAGGGGAARNESSGSNDLGGGGGGTGLTNGKGTSGTGGASSQNGNGDEGLGGSGGNNGGGTRDSDGGDYGGGGGAMDGTLGNWGRGGDGAVRVLWGDGRFLPSNQVGAADTGYKNTNGLARPYSLSPTEIVILNNYQAKKGDMVLVSSPAVTNIVSPTSPKNGDVFAIYNNYETTLSITVDSGTAYSIASGRTVGFIYSNTMSAWLTQYKYTP